MSFSSGRIYIPPPGMGLEYGGWNGQERENDEGNGREPGKMEKSELDTPIAFGLTLPDFLTGPRHGDL